MTHGLFPERIETDRLVFERLCHANVDLFELYRICSADDGIEEVAEYMPGVSHASLDETEEAIDWAEQRWEDGENARYVIRPASGEDGAGELAGVTGLNPKWERRAGLFMIWLRKRFWGRGYSAERAAAFMDLAFERLDFELISVMHHVENENSQRAVEKYIDKYGGQRDGILRNWTPIGDEVTDQYLYTVTRAQYDDTAASDEP